MPVRWRFFLVVFATAFLSYNLRQDIHVAAEYMMPELGLDEVQMGWIFASFIWGYTLFQLPGGILGRRVGARLLVSLLGVVWMLCAVLSGTLPGLLFSSTGAIIAGLCAVRFVVGAAHAPLFPVQAGLLEAWFPVGHWGLPNALQSAGLALGAAATQPLVAWVMHAWGWRAAFFVFLPAGVLVFALWWWYARNTPAEHPAVDAAELAVIGAGREALSRDVDGRAWLRLLRNRDTLLLAACYFAMNYVFYLFFTWFFHYLVNELGFSVLQTGFLAALPWLCGAFAAALGGWSCDRLCARLGPRWGCRLPASGGLLATAGLLWAGLYAPNAGVAVALLSLCFACTQFTEAAFWEAQTFIAGAQTAPAAGIMNTGGNLAGIVVAPLMPWLAERVGWVTALSTGVAVAAAGGLLWLLVRADRRFDADPAVELARR